MYFLQVPNNLAFSQKYDTKLGFGSIKLGRFCYWPEVVGESPLGKKRYSPGSQVRSSQLYSCCEELDEGCPSAPKGSPLRFKWWWWWWWLLLLWWWWWWWLCGLKGDEEQIQPGEHWPLWCRTLLLLIMELLPLLWCWWGGGGFKSEINMS